jgi:hypothetical protein
LARLQSPHRSLRSRVHLRHLQSIVIVRGGRGVLGQVQQRHGRDAALLVHLDPVDDGADEASPILRRHGVPDRVEALEHLGDPAGLDDALGECGRRGVEISEALLVAGEVVAEFFDALFDEAAGGAFGGGEAVDHAAQLVA